MTCSSFVQTCYLVLMKSLAKRLNLFRFSQTKILQKREKFGYACPASVYYDAVEPRYNAVVAVSEAR